MERKTSFIVEAGNLGQGTPPIDNQWAKDLKMGVSRVYRWREGPHLETAVSSDSHLEIGLISIILTALSSIGLPLWLSW